MSKQQNIESLKQKVKEILQNIVKQLKLPQNQQLQLMSVLTQTLISQQNLMLQKQILYECMIKKFIQHNKHINLTKPQFQYLISNVMQKYFKHYQLIQLALTPSVSNSQQHNKKYNIIKLNIDIPTIAPPLSQAIEKGKLQGITFDQKYFD